MIDPQEWLFFLATSNNMKEFPFLGQEEKLPNSLVKFTPRKLQRLEEEATWLKKLQLKQPKDKVLDKTKETFQIRNEIRKAEVASKSILITYPRFCDTPGLVRSN